MLRRYVDESEVDYSIPNQHAFTSNSYMEGSNDDRSISFSDRTWISTSPVS